MTEKFVTLQREVLEQMIENMKSIVGDSGYDRMLTRESEQILRAALEQPQAEQPAMTPIAQRKLDSLLTEGYTISGYSVYHEQKHQHGFVTGAGLVGWWRSEGMEYPQPQGELEPVAWYDGNKFYGSKAAASMNMTNMSVLSPVYTHPQPKREPPTTSNNLHFNKPLLRGFISDTI